MLKTSAAGLAFIRSHEGLELNAYLDRIADPPVWTIGFGDTGPHVRAGMRITREQAEEMLASRVAREFEPAVREAIGDTLTTQAQFDAMVSLAYNIGARRFKGSSVAREHRAGNYSAAEAAFALWNRAGGKVIRGLVNRRAAEAKLYASEPPASAVNAELDDLADVIYDVLRVQERLRKLGYYKHAIDGAAGEHTSNAAMAAWRRFRELGGSLERVEGR